MITTIAEPTARVVAGSFSMPSTRKLTKINFSLLRVVAGSLSYAKLKKTLTQRVELPANAGSLRQTTRKKYLKIPHSYPSCGKLRVVKSTISRFLNTSSNTLSICYREPLLKLPATSRNFPQHKRNYTLSLINSLRVVENQLPANLVTPQNHRTISP